MQAIFIFLLLLLLTIGSGCRTNETDRRAERELEIFKTLLDNKPKEIIVVDESVFDPFAAVETGALKEILKGLQNDTFENFTEANKARTKIDDNIQTILDYPLMTGSDFEKMDSKPVSYYAFSRVGFSNDGKQAVVWFSQVCLPLCSKGAYFLLENKKGTWVITQESEAVKS